MTQSATDTVTTIPATTTEYPVALAPPSTLQGRNPEYELLAWTLFNVNDPAAWNAFVTGAEPDQFINAGCREIAERMISMKSEHQFVNAVALCHEGTSTDMLCAVRDMLGNACTTYWGPGDYPVLAVRYWAHQVALSAYQRQASSKMRALLGKCEDGSLTPEHLDASWRDIRAYAKLNESVTISAREAMMEALAEIEKAATDEAEPVVSTGITKLDECTNGFERGELWIIGARPSQGKTALAVKMLIHASKNDPAAFVSLETSARRIMQRWIVIADQIPMHELKSGKLPPSRTRQMIELCREIVGRRLNILDKPGASIGEIEAWMDIQQEILCPRVVFLDYLTLIQKTDPRQDLREHVDAVVTSLKNFAMRRQITVVLLAQLNRGTNEEARPAMNRLKESGGIEQAADKILFIHRPEKDEADLAVENCELIVAKQKDGATGIIRSLFRRETMTFSGDDDE